VASSTCLTLLGCSMRGGAWPGYKIVEIGFDVPGPGAVNQPWHRDFATPPETLIGRRLSSLAFNVTTVDVYEDMGPFEIAPGTQWDDLSEFGTACSRPSPSTGAMRSAAEDAEDGRHFGAIISDAPPRYGQSLGQVPSVLVLGIEAPDATQAVQHNLQVTKTFYRLPNQVRRHLACRLVDQLEPMCRHTALKGLLMGPDQEQHGAQLALLQKGGVLALSLTLKPIAQTYSD